MWRYKYPTRDEFESEEEYQARCEAYERAEDDYIDEYIDRCREERNGQRV